MRKRNRLVQGVGINDSQTPISSYIQTVNGTFIQGWVCPFYRVWVRMLRRCYDNRLHKSQPTYTGCSVCEEWLTFSNFKAWMEQQDWEGKDLDKDLLVQGNKIYSPEMCVFLDSRINSFLTESSSIRGDFPIGVYFNKKSNKFMAYCSDPYTNKLEYLGLFDCPSKAHDAWLVRKLEHANDLAMRQTNPKVAKALVERYKNYKNPIDNHS